MKPDTPETFRFGVFELDAASGGCGGSEPAPVDQEPTPIIDEPIFTTLKAGKCGNDCDSDTDILPGA